MRVALVGGVRSTQVALESLRSHNYQDVDVYGYEPKKTSNVSGYVNLRESAVNAGYQYFPFVKINDMEEKFAVEAYDYIFVIGLSQLVSDGIIKSARNACIGFHPTKLPKGRGRAPIAWLVLEEAGGSATLFKIRPRDKADAGPIIARSDFEVDRKLDTASSVEDKILTHLALSLEDCLTQLREGELVGEEQVEAESSEYGVRRPEDGFIDWYKRAEEVSLDIRCAMHPHPGAFAFIKEKRVHIEWIDREIVKNIRGVVGRVLKKDRDDYLVQAGCGALWVKIYGDFPVGQQFGVSSPAVVHDLECRLATVEKIVQRIING